MSVIGFNFEKGGYRYSILEGKKNSPILKRKEKERNLLADNISTISAFVDSYESRLRNLIELEIPEKIGIRLQQSPNGLTQDKIRYWYYPISVLHLIGFREQIPVFEFNAQSFSPAKFGFPKGTSLSDGIDELFPDMKNPWDNSQKYSVYAALSLLE